ncbi:TRAP transporter substrate-binding protein [Frigidibacter sp.]|uniref:TRAP transporter substrate-binding protein n=1 Tax=Frigidibacter sp. TaxID=2586418 RepID=UPI00273757E1|nr:TRAP transporter substrate-binding protein [Frigidibacter sp.]MDP3342203.1 TRAP transporter substrate-binding protein [Frigidibacter sp.]
MRFARKAAFAAVVLYTATTAVSAETLKVSSYLPPNHTFNQALGLWSEELSEKTGGELSLEVFPAAQLGPPPRQFDLVTSGAADMAIILHSATPGRFPMTELAGLPLSHPAEGDASAVSSRRLTELAPDYLAAEHPGTRILWMAVTPPLKVHFRDRKPTSVSDLSGLRVRYAGTIWQQIIEAVGASPLPVPPGETADALSKGVIDAAAFPFEATKSFDLGPVTKFSMEPGLASASFAVVISDSAYARLTPEQQALVVETTGPERAAWFGAMWDAGEAEGRDYMVENGVEILSLPDAEQEKLRAAISPIVDSAVAATGGRGAEFLADYMK